MDNEFNYPASEMIPSRKEKHQSAILAALNVPPEYADGTLRISLGITTTEEDVHSAAETLGRVFQILQQRSAADGR